MAPGQAKIFSSISVSATVILLALLAAFELNPAVSPRRRALLLIDMALLGLVVILGAVTHG